MAYRGMIQVVADYIFGSRVIPAKDVDPETEAKLREQHAVLRKKMRDFRSACVEMTDEWWAQYTRVTADVAEFETMCEEKYGLDLERKWWLED